MAHAQKAVPSSVKRQTVHIPISRQYASPFIGIAGQNIKKFQAFCFVSVFEYQPKRKDQQYIVVEGEAKCVDQVLPLIVKRLEQIKSLFEPEAPTPQCNRRNRRTFRWVEREIRRPRFE